MKANNIYQAKIETLEVSATSKEELIILIDELRLLGYKKSGKINKSDKCKTDVWVEMSKRKIGMTNINKL